VTVVFTFTLLNHVTVGLLKAEKHIVAHMNIIIQKLPKAGYNHRLIQVKETWDIR